jgi:hypothetical protein
LTKSGRVLGEKLFQLTNHLGNVLAVVSDKKILNSDGTYSADVMSTSDFYPFGMMMPGRSYKPDIFRYGFNNHEKDNEVSGIGNHISWGNYGYDSRLARRWGLDPVDQIFMSNYSVLGNSPIWYFDPDGRQKYKKNYTSDPANSGDLSADIEFFKDMANLAVDKMGDFGKLLKNNVRQAGLWLVGSSGGNNESAKVESVVDTEGNPTVTKVNVDDLMILLNLNIGTMPSGKGFESLGDITNAFSNSLQEGVNAAKEIKNTKESESQERPKTIFINMVNIETGSYSKNWEFIPKTITMPVDQLDSFKEANPDMNIMIENYFVIEKEK